MPKLPSVNRERSPRVSKKVKAKKKREDQSKVLEKVLNQIDKATGSKTSKTPVNMKKN